jgi:hypothetical protein
LSVLKSDDTFILKTKVISEDFNECFFEKFDYISFKYVTGLIIEERQCSLIFIDMNSKTLFYVNPSSENDKTRRRVYEKWM